MLVLPQNLYYRGLTVNELADGLLVRVTVGDEGLDDWAMSAVIQLKLWRLTHFSTSPMWLW
jgi:hypothetical protein